MRRIKLGIKRFLPILMLVVLMFNLFVPLVVLAEGDEDKPEEEEVGLSASENLKTDSEKYETYLPSLKYNKEMHREMTYRILSDAPLKSTSYGQFYATSPSETAFANKSYGYGLGAVTQNLAQSAVKGEETSYKGAYTLAWTPLYMFGEDGKLAKLREIEELVPFVVKYVTITGNTRPVLFGDLFYDEKLYDTTDRKKVYAKLNIGVDTNLLVKEAFGVQIGKDDSAIKGKKVDEKTRIKEVKWDFDEKYYENALAKHSLYEMAPTKAATWGGISKGSTGAMYVGNRDADRIKTGWHWSYAISRLALLTHGTQTSNTLNDHSEMLVGMDSYGNVITHLNDVIIPYWSNTVFNEFSYLDGEKKFISHPMNKNLDGTAADVMKKALTNEKNDFYELKDDYLWKSCFQNVFEGKQKSSGKKTLKPNGMAELKKCYNDDAFVKKVSDFIVNTTSKQVNAYNKKYITYSGKDGAEIYLSRSLAGHDYLMSGKLETLEGAQEYIYSAEGLIERIGRVLDVGLFELMRLTIAAMIADFYNSSVINFAMGDIFYTKLVSESDFVKKSLNTLLLVVVSFMAIYVLILVVRMMMGFITIKGIISRFVLLAVATLMPILVYSPLVDLGFNKPVNMILGKEVNRMFMMDVWLKSWEDAVEDADVASFLPKSNLRERKEEYTVQFFTSRHVDGYNLNTEDGRMLSNNNPVPEDVVVVNVSAFHLSEWLASGSSDPLFEYLMFNFPNNYAGINEYDEYVYVSDFSIGSTDYKGSNVKASDMLRQVYRAQWGAKSTDGSLPAVPVNKELYKVMTNLFNSGKYDQNKAEIVLRDIALNSTSRKLIYGKGNGFDSKTKGVYAKESLTLPRQDVLKINDIMKARMKNSLYGANDIADSIYSVNEKVINDYMKNYLHLHRDTSTPYLKAEAFVLSLNTFLAMNEELGYPLFPTHFEQSSVTLDTYIRALFIPLTEFTPEASDIDNVSHYITLRNDIVSASLFALSVLLLFAYGAFKFLAVTVLLMPVIMAMFFYNYVWLENKDSKVWAGALGILGSFALVNLGLIGMFKSMIYYMNLSDIEKGSVGTNMYPVVIIHSILLISYLILAFMVVLKPMAKTVWADKANLGGEKMSAGALKLKGNLTTGMKNFWNNLTDSGSRNEAMANALSKTKVGAGAVAAGAAAREAMRGGIGNKRTGMAEKLDANSIKANMNPGEAAKDADEAAKVSEHLANASGDRSKGKDPKKVKDPVIAGDNAMVRALGLNGLHEFIQEQRKLGTEDDSSLFERLKNAKDAAGKAFVESGVEWDANNSKSLMSKVKDLVKIGEEIDEIPDLPEKHVEELSADEMKLIEEMGLDSKVVASKDGTNSNPLKLAVGSGLAAGVLAGALGNSMTVARNGNDLFVDASSEVMKDAVQRKALFTPVMESIETKIKDISKMKFKKDTIDTDILPEKVSDREYKFEASEVTDGIVSYVEKLKADGKDVSIVKDSAGNATMTFGEDMAMTEVNSLVGGIEAKSVAMSKMLGVSPKASYDIKARKLRKLTEVLNDKGIEYTVEENAAEGVSNVKIAREYQVAFDNILAEDQKLARSVTQLSSGIEKIEGNEIVLSDVQRRVDSGELTIGVDVDIQEDVVYVKSDNAKRLMTDVESNFGKLKNESIVELKEVVVDVARTIVGDGGFDMTEHVRAENAEMEPVLMSGGLGRETYTLNNRSFKSEELDTSIRNIRKRMKAKPGESQTANGRATSVTAEEKKLVEIYERAQAVGLEFKRESDNRLVASSLISGQAELVEEMMKAKAAADAVRKKKADKAANGHGPDRGPGNDRNGRGNGSESPLEGRPERRSAPRED